MKNRNFKFRLFSGNEFFEQEVFHIDLPIGYRNKRELLNHQSEISQSFLGLTIKGNEITGSRWEMLPQVVETRERTRQLWYSLWTQTMDSSFIVELNLWKMTNWRKKFGKFSTVKKVTSNLSVKNHLTLNRVETRWHENTSEQIRGFSLWNFASSPCRRSAIPFRNLTTTCCGFRPFQEPPW